jgi:hypothetical protein
MNPCAIYEAQTYVIKNFSCEYLLIKRLNCKISQKGLVTQELIDFALLSESNTIQLSLGTRSKKQLS